ncbi:SH3 domain-containing protein [Hyphococcus formosus]|uniref:SH3 domain-containing protein n=1 Tax=Hyphococcus formosus TaxID=3143534 RepID=UPI00398AC856
MFRGFIQKTAPIFTLLGAFTLGACSTLSSMDPFGGDDINYAKGADLSSQLSRADHDALAYAFVHAMNTGKPQGWRGSSARGVVEPESYAIANLKGNPDARIDASRGDFELTHMVETEMGLYVLTRNSNIRTAPSTKGKIAEVLPSGSGVDVVGRVTDKNWMLIAANDTVRGYVFGDLLIKAPGSELELAGGPVRMPVLCRKFSQRINIYSERTEWSGAACNDGTGWRLAPPEPEAPTADDELLGL